MYDYNQDISTAGGVPDILLIDNKTVKIKEIEWFRSVYPNCKIIIISNELVQFEIISAIKVGVSGYMIKANNIHALYDRIITVYTGGYFLGSHVAKIVMNWIENENGFSKWSTLSKRESDFAEALFKGLTYKQIADSLHVSTSTVNFHLQNIYSKLNVKSRAEFVSKYKRDEVNK
jgi:NarL family two-component system response regulator LiaR